ncbi:DUF6168 family protein [Robiginitalea sp. SC105]|uniref:DUF6168 family protein n=1 Tax=Robiginitalea sp. SC105 TaxID=2762332 RepID=UPI00163955AF|nr:DUF6168 family protein [Robiginitalea sp. SC105]MBC2838260.1 hypothetical protein [Robiginitalea sp. SC105]
MTRTDGFLLRFTLLLTTLLGAAYATHSWIRAQNGLDPSGDLLPASYILNYLLAAGIVWCLYIFRRKIRQQIGFLFIGGSLLKFLAFFIFLYPTYQADGEMSRTEFASFFIPYLIALLAETYFTAKILRDLEKQDSP